MVAVGFNPRFRCSPTACVAERRMNPSLAIFRCRSATQYQFGLAVHRGLKPTATLKPLLRDDPSELRTLRQVAVRPAGPVWPSERARASQSRIGNPQMLRTSARSNRLNALPAGSRRYGGLESCATPATATCNKLRCTQAVPKALLPCCLRSATILTAAPEHWLGLG
jgi:hypothetical protein